MFTLDQFCNGIPHNLHLASDLLFQQNDILGVLRGSGIRLLTGSSAEDRAEKGNFR